MRPKQTRCRASSAKCSHHGERVEKVSARSGHVRVHRQTVDPDNSQLVAFHSGQLRVLDGNPAGDRDVRAMVRSLLTGDSGEGVRRDRPWTENVIHQIVTNRNGDPATQNAVANELRRIGDRDVVALCLDSDQIGARTDATTEEYQRAVKHATRAGELAPWSAYCLGVLGVAKYRVADYIGALEAFGRARDIRSGVPAGRARI